MQHHAPTQQQTQRRTINELKKHSVDILEYKLEVALHNYHHCPVFVRESYIDLADNIETAIAEKQA